MTSTSQSPSLIEFTIWSFLIILKGLLNNTKHKASSNVDLPEPFLPITSVVGASSRLTLIAVFPVERKFFHDIVLNVIILDLLYIIYVQNLSIVSYLNLCLFVLYNYLKMLEYLLLGLICLL